MLVADDKATSTINVKNAHVIKDKNWLKFQSSNVTTAVKTI
jgi:hypothetical protein